MAYDSNCDVVHEVAQNKAALKKFSADLLIHMMNRDFGVAFELADILSLIEDIATRCSVISFTQERSGPEILDKFAKYYHLTKQA